MTIKEVSQKYNISQDTLRYYERVGLIPTVARTSGGIRNYTENDLGWVENAICMRNAEVPIEALFEARRQLLQEQLDALKEQHAQIEATMKRLKYKISRYENAVKTGVLSWDDCPEDINIKHS